jgi:GTPase SAR1 family protein
MGQVTSELSKSDTRMPRNLKFRVLIIGRANAGKTSILQRVCDTTESPKIYKRDQRGRRERVRSRFLLPRPVSSFSQVQLDPTAEVGQVYSYWQWLIMRMLLSAWFA